MNRFWKPRRLESLPRHPKWVPILGELQKTLQKGEYLPLGPLPMFESNFVQVTNRGCPVYVHHRPNRVTMGVAASLPGLVMPDLLLIGQPPDGKHSSLVLTRMIPLTLARLFVHEMATWRLKLRLATGRYYHLELDAPNQEASFLFNRWIRLINQLQEPAPAWAPQVDMHITAVPPSTWQLQDHEDLCKHSEVDLEPTYPFSALALPHRQRKVKALQRKFKSKAVGDSLPLVWSKQLEKSQTTKKKGIEKTSPSLYLPTSQTHVPVSEKHSITIQTIFSIISDTVNNQSSTKVGLSDGQDDGPPGRIVESSEHCIPPNKQSLSILGSYNHQNQHLWQQGLEELKDPESSSMSSSSLDGVEDSPSFQETKPFPHSHKHLAKSWLFRPPKKTGIPLMKKAHSVPITSRKAPVLLDQSQKAPAQKALHALALQKERDIPGPSRKVLPMWAVSRKGHEPPEPHRMGANHKWKPSLYISPRQRARGPRPEVTPATKACVGQQGLSSGKEDGEQRGKKKGPPEVRRKWAPPVHRHRCRTVVELELPSHRGQGQTLEGPLGEERLGDKAYGIPRKTYIERTDFLPLAEHQKWDKCPVLAVAPTEQGRPFSPKGLAVAKLIIMAQPVDQQEEAPGEVTMPSWLSFGHLQAASVQGQVDYDPNQEVLKDGTSVLLRKTVMLASKSQERIEGSRGKGKDLPRNQGEASTMPPNISGATSGLKIPVLEEPIPLPLSTWEEGPPTPISQMPITQLEERMSYLKKGFQDLEPEFPQPTMATVGSNSQTLLQSLKMMQKEKELIPTNMETEEQKDAAPKENLGAPVPLLHRYSGLGNQVDITNPVSGGVQRDQQL